MARLRRILASVGVGRVERAIAEEPISRAVELIRAALRDGIDDPANRSPEFGAIAGGLNLEFEHGVLADTGGNRRAAPDIDTPLLGDIVSVLQEGVAPGNSAK